MYIGSFIEVEHFRRHHIMETFNITYSNKNIPIPSKNEYKLKLIMKTENFLKRMCWKALAFISKLKLVKKKILVLKNLITIKQKQ